MSQPRKNSASHPAKMTISEPENLEEGEGSHHVLRLDKLMPIVMLTKSLHLK